MHNLTNLLGLYHPPRSTWKKWARGQASATHYHMKPYHLMGLTFISLSAHSKYCFDDRNALPEAWRAFQCVWEALPSHSIRVKVHETLSQWFETWCRAPSKKSAEEWWCAEEKVHYKARWHFSFLIFFPKKNKGMASTPTSRTHLQGDSHRDGILCDDGGSAWCVEGCWDANLTERLQKFSFFRTHSFLRVLPPGKERF